MDKKINSENYYDLEFKDGDLFINVNHDSGGLDAQLVLRLKSEYFLDKLKVAIPGDIDDSVIDLIKAAIKS